MTCNKRYIVFNNEGHNLGKITWLTSWTDIADCTRVCKNNKSIYFLSTLQMCRYIKISKHIDYLPSTGKVKIQNYTKTSKGLTYK